MFVCVCMSKGGVNVLGSSRSGRLSMSGPSPGFGAATNVRLWTWCLVNEEEAFLNGFTALRRIILDSILSIGVRVSIS